MDNIKIVPAICPMCGANIQVKREDEAAICEYCGRAFIVDKAIEKYDSKIRIDKVEYKGIGYGLGKAKELEQQRKLEEERFQRDHAEDIRKDERFYALLALGIFIIMSIMWIILLMI